MFHWKKHARYEVVAEQAGHASIDGIFETEREAVERATYLLSLAKFTRVQVVQVAKHTQAVVFERASQAGGAGVVGITAIEDAHVCNDVLDVYGHPSRMTLLRLTRRHADRQIAIPCETLHDYLALRLIEREGMLLNSGIARLARVQSRENATVAAERERELGALWLRLKQLAQTSDSLAGYGKLLIQKGLGALQEQVASTCAPAECDRVVSYAFARLLEGHRDWGTKTRALIRVLEEDDGDATGIAWVDQVLAETIDGRDPIKVLIGYSPDLGSALGSLLATLNGRLDYFGSTVNLAARLEGLSQGGDIVLSDRLASDPVVSAVISPLHSAVESAELKGFGAPVSFRRLVPDVVNPYTALS